MDLASMVLDWLVGWLVYLNNLSSVDIYVFMSLVLLSYLDLQSKMRPHRTVVNFYK